MSVQETYLQGIADAIRSKDGTTAPIQAAAFANRISAIQVGVSNIETVYNSNISGNFTYELDSSCVYVLSMFRYYTEHETLYAIIKNNELVTYERLGSRKYWSISISENKLKVNFGLFSDGYVFLTKLS